MKDILINKFHLDEYLDEPSLQLITQSSQQITLSKGEIIQRDHNECMSVPFVADGLLRLYKVSKSGREMNIHRIASGEICVIAALCTLTDNQYEFSVCAETDTNIISVNSSCFKTLVETNPKFNKLIFTLISNKLIHVLNLHEKVHLSSIEERLSEYLIDHAVDGIVRKTHEEIACDIGSSRVVISRAIAKLRKENKIATGRHEIHITH